MKHNCIDYKFIWVIKHDRIDYNLWDDVKLL